MPAALGVGSHGSVRPSRSLPQMHGLCPGRGQQKTVLRVWSLVPQGGRHQGQRLGRLAPLQMPFAMREGDHGRYWYNRRTGAYFDDYQQYHAVQRASDIIPLPFYQPTIMFLLVYAASFFFGGVLGHALAMNAKHTWSRVMAYAVCILVCLIIASSLWCGPRYCCNVEESKNAEMDQISGNRN
ncbi:uncharacterized protein LOC119367638 [Triticum dicoccoides]|uniref:uncharacterized protein LOC119367638 n=1 Tax=Triticum dicoccoides TaxID=85692 RepID=UPI00188FDF32|nr:uncharacterized protein LOC119367638 [Triticum dicoccoides]